MVKKNGIEFPYGVKEDGSCEMLKDNKCKVYDNRPDICSIDKVIGAFGFDKDEYYKKSIIKCNIMMDEDNISNEYKIKTII